MGNIPLLVEVFAFLLFKDTSFVLPFDFFLLGIFFGGGGWDDVHVVADVVFMFSRNC